MSDDNGKDDKVTPLKPEPYRRGTAEGKLASTPDRDGLLPSPDAPYKAAGLVENNEVSRLVLVMGKEGFKAGGTAYVSLQYVHLGLGEFGFDENGQWFSYVFSDIQAKLLKVHGRNILKYFDYISLRRLPWIRLADRDFRPGDGVADDEPIFTKIAVENWKPPKGQPPPSPGSSASIG
jgi:hypothetical protein